MSGAAGPLLAPPAPEGAVRRSMALTVSTTCIPGTGYRLRVQY